jgi:hypothetical protein
MSSLRILYVHEVLMHCSGPVVPRWHLVKWAGRTIDVMQIFLVGICILKFGTHTYTFIHKELEMNMSQLYYMINLIHAAPR